MDTVTHALMGAAISDALFRKRLGPLATPFALFVAAAPDLDIPAVWLFGHHAWLEHRGLTHSFLPQTLAAPLFGLAAWLLVRKKGGFTSWSLLALLCLFSHTLLDLATSWGTMPFLPFSWDRVSWDIAPIIDIFVLSFTATSFLANRILRWERVEHPLNPIAYPKVHEHPRRRKAADWLARLIVGLCLIYLLIGWHQNRQTVRKAGEALRAEGIVPTEVRASPIMFTYIAWEIAAKDAEGNIYNAVHSSYAPQPMEFKKAVNSDHPDVKKALASRDGRRFLWRTQGMVVATRLIDAAEDGVISLQDRRFFALEPSWPSRFILELRVGANEEVERFGVRRSGITGPGARAEFRRLWELMWKGRIEG